MFSLKILKADSHCETAFPGEEVLSLAKEVSEGN
jgi:hypothetical protein